MILNNFFIPDDTILKMVSVTNIKGEIHLDLETVVKPILKFSIPSPLMSDNDSPIKELFYAYGDKYPFVFPASLDEKDIDTFSKCGCNVALIELGETVRLSVLDKFFH